VDRVLRVTHITQLADTIHPRIYAITLRNRILVAYFGILAVTRLVMGLVTAFVHSPGIATNLQFKLIPNTIGTVFGMWLRTLVDTELQNILLTENSHAELSVFLVVVWYTYRNKGTSSFQHYFAGLWRRPRYISWLWSPHRYTSRCLSGSPYGNSTISTEFLYIRVK